MPTPRKGESKQAFTSRCISVVKKEDPSISNEHAAGKCHGIYDSWKNKADSSVPDRQRIADFMDDWDCLKNDGVTESDNQKLKELGE